MSILLRLIIIGASSSILWQFQDDIWGQIGTVAAFEARGFNLFFAICVGILGPLIAVSAIVLAVINRHLLAAGILAGLGIVVFYVPSLTFLVGVMIYGF
jgi:hypothetical protein